MRISDWSSDVFSSDLIGKQAGVEQAIRRSVDFRRVIAIPGLEPHVRVHGCRIDSLRADDANFLDHGPRGLGRRLPGPHADHRSDEHCSAHATYQKLPQSHARAPVPATVRRYCLGKQSNESLHDRTPDKIIEGAEYHEPEDENQPDFEPELLRAHPRRAAEGRRSEEHTSELQSLMRISYAVFCLKKK